MIPSHSRIDSRLSLLLLVAIGLALVLVMQRSSADQPAASAEIVPPHQFDYLDSHDRRRLADVRLKIVDHNGRRSLEMVISAVGPQVDAIPGFAGVRGANRHTAEQFENIVTGRFSLWVVSGTDHESGPWRGTWREGRRGPIPERRLRQDGRIDFLAVTPRDYPLELVIDTYLLVEGRQISELWFDELPRLRITYNVTGNKVQVLGFESLSDEPGAKEPPNPPQPKTEKPADQPAADQPGRPPVTDADWDALDGEGKWILYQKLIRGNEKLAKDFVPYLIERKDFDFLEMIALNQPLYLGGLTAARALALADAPQWVRVAVWLRQTDVGHGELESTKILLKCNPAKALAWLEKYGTDLNTEYKGSVGSNHPVLSDLAKLRKMNLAPAELGTAAPPIKPADVFRCLDAPRVLTDFGDRKRADRGVVYTHQVLRAINALVQSGRYHEPWIGKVRKLTQHPEAKVRQAALLAFTNIGYALDRKDSAPDDFRQIMDDPKETPDVREAALMAFSVFDHPQVYVRLHELALEPNHPAWPAAISRLRDLGNEFTLQHLDRIDRDKLSDQNAAILEKTRDELRKWVEDPSRAREVSLAFVTTQLECAAWAEYTRSPLQEPLALWTKSYFTKHPDDGYVKLLEQVHAEYAARHKVPDSEALTRHVRGMANWCLAQKP